MIGRIERYVCSFFLKRGWVVNSKGMQPEGGRVTRKVPLSVGAMLQTSHG